MVSLQKVENDLKKIGQSFSFWGKNEIRELSKVLSENEQIIQCVNGHYEGGWAMLTATDKRILLIDRKPMFLTIEAIWYDRINQVDFNHRLMNATLHIFSMGKEIAFTSWNHARLRNVMLYSQEKMIEKRQDGHYRTVQDQTVNADGVINNSVPLGQVYSTPSSAANFVNPNQVESTRPVNNQNLSLDENNDYKWQQSYNSASPDYQYHEQPLNYNDYSSAGNHYEQANTDSGVVDTQNSTTAERLMNQVNDNPQRKPMETFQVRLPFSRRRYYPPTSSTIQP